MSPVTPENINRKFGREYWRSLDDFAGTPEFQQAIENEFPSMLDEVITPGNRRSFLKLMGASLALAGIGLPGCRRWPDEKIKPFAHRPDGYIPGEPVKYATAWEMGGVGRGLIATTYDGRPTKVDGNELDPITRGSSDAYTQATILGFYDPERSRVPLHNGEAAEWDAFVTEFETLMQGHAESGGSGVAILSEASSSPVIEDMRARLRTAMPSAVWYEYESVSRDNELEGARQAFGKAVRTHYNAADADVIVCLDADFLNGMPASPAHARDWATRRGAVDHSMPRMYGIEGVLSLTGACADHRLAVKSRDVASIAAAIAAKLGGHGVSVLGASQLNGNAHGHDALLDAIAEDLSKAKGRSIVVAGARQPAAVHALAHAINFALGNISKTVNYTEEPNGNRMNHAATLAALAKSMSSGSIRTLIVLGGNPVYDAPADVDFAAALANVDTAIHLSLYADETSRSCTWHVPQAHFLESWGAVRAWDGSYMLAQPMIDPLYGGKSSIELLAMMIGDDLSSGYDLVRRWYRERRGDANFEPSWRRMVHDGIIHDTAWTNINESVEITAGSWTSALNEVINAAAGDEGFEVVFMPDPAVYDGRFANNGWLQELPDPIAKIAWDNAAFMSPATAEAIGVKGDQRVLVDTNAGTPLNIVVHVVPGYAEGCIGINLGYGRGEAAGHIGTNVGFNANTLRLSSGNGMNIAGNVIVEKTSGSYQLATTQDHHAMDSQVTRDSTQERLPAILREAPVDAYIEDPKTAFGHFHEMPIVSLWEEYKFQDRTNQWGMSIDLTKCIGCNSCVIACQAENNIPVVGKDQVSRGREMHWIRVDRYFAFTPDNREHPKHWDTSSVDRVAFQPVPCQQCENAPCEQVCPVAATTHDKEGLNVMVYNRCVGTRYCSNNCPYKVRRFNFYNWHYSDPRKSGLKAPALMIPDQQDVKAFEGDKQTLKMGFNPDVTVRTRGVMEKCSFCVQRLNRAKIRAKNAWVKQDEDTRGDHPAVSERDVMTACAQACPTQAIVFGDLNNPDHQIAGIRGHDKREYSLLDELNTKPRTKYLARILNERPEFSTLARHTSGHGHEEGDSSEPNSNAGASHE